MSKIRIHIPQDRVQSLITLDQKEIVHKLKDVVRLHAGQSVYVFDGCGKEYVYQVSRSQKDSVVLQSQELVRNEKSTPTRIALGFPLVKEDKTDYILQKATELGVSEFMPFISSRSIQSSPGSAKCERWRRIIMEAARQSDRLWTPELKDTCDFPRILQAPCACKIAAHQTGARLDHAGLLSLVKDKKEILLVVGPEGDFSDPEIAQLRLHGFIFLNLSDNILRVETAAAFSVGLLNFLVAAGAGL